MLHSSSMKLNVAIVAGDSFPLENLSYPREANTCVESVILHEDSCFHESSILDILVDKSDLGIKHSI